MLLESTLSALDTCSRSDCYLLEWCHKQRRILHYHWWQCSVWHPLFQRHQALGVGWRRAGMLLSLSPCMLSASCGILGLPLLPRQAG